MKKIFISLLAIAALASCAKTEAVYTEADSEIKLAPVTSLATKANVFKAIDGTAYPAAEHFTVIGYWNAAGAGTSFADGTTYLDAVDFAKQTTSNYWAGVEESYYWPKNGSLRFACYSPTEMTVKSMTHDLATDTWTATDFVQSNDTDETIDFMVAQTPPSYTATTAAENVSVVFEHALSWLSFRVQAEDDAAAEAFDVKGITVNGVFTKGDMEAKYPAKAWEVTEGSEKTYSVCTDAPDLETKPVDVGNTGVLVIPQKTTTVTVTFVQNTLSSVNQELELPLILDPLSAEGESTPWEAGKHYIYTLVFGLDEILINPSVADWEDVIVPAIDATALEVGSPAELISAVRSGRSVRLISDITIKEPVVVTDDVQVELNGYTINAATPWIDSSDDSENAYAFWVKNDGELTINGPGKVETAACAYSMAVWADGGKVVINGGEYYNAGEGSDLIYAKNGGEVSIYGGYFKACEKTEGTSGTEELYSALNLSGSTSNNKITVYGGTFYGFNPADNVSENPAVNFVAKGYNVVSTDNNGVAEYTVTAPGSVELAADAVVYGSVNVKNGVFNGGNFTLTVPETPENNGIIRPAGNVTIYNVTIDGQDKSWNDNGLVKGLRGIYVNDGGNYIVDNAIIEGCTYAINVNTTKPVTLKVTNSTLEGWTSFGSSTTAEFANVKFTIGTQKTFRPYGTTILTGCSFEDGFTIDLSELTETVVFENCTYGEEALTEENLQNKDGKSYTIR